MTTKLAYPQYAVVAPPFATPPGPQEPVDIGVDTGAAVQQSTPASLSKRHMSDGGTGSAAVGARVPWAGAQVKEWRTVAELLLNSSQLECEEVKESITTAAVYANQDPLVRQTIIPLRLLGLTEDVTSTDQLRVSSGWYVYLLPSGTHHASCTWTSGLQMQYSAVRRLQRVGCMCKKVHRY